MENIITESKIIKELLGFNVSKLDNNYKITDEKGNQIGFIKYKKDSNKENEFYDKHKYYTQINTDELVVESDAKCPDFPSTPSTLSIYYKKIGTDIIIHIGSEFTAIRMHLTDNKILILYIDKNQFFMVCKEPYDYYLEQYVHVNLIEKSYTYNISFVDIKDIKHNYPVYLGKLQCQTVKPNSGLITVKNTWPFWRGKESKNHKSSYISTVQGTIEESILNHKMGIDAFNRMRYLMNTIQFKEDIINFAIKNTEFELPQCLDLFVPEIKNQSNTNKLVKQKNKSSYKI